MYIYHKNRKVPIRPCGQATFSMPLSNLQHIGRIPFSQAILSGLAIRRARLSGPSASRLPSPDFLSKPWTTTSASKERNRQEFAGYQQRQPKFNQQETSSCYAHLERVSSDQRGQSLPAVSVHLCRLAWLS